MERREVPISILQSFQTLSLSPTSIVFGKEFAISTSPEKFVATVNQYLHLHTSSKVEKLHIYFCPWEQYHPDIRNWIAFAVAKGVEDLQLDLSMGFDPCKYAFTNGAKPFQLCHSLSKCDTFTSLSMSHCDFCPSNFSFCQLQSLSFTNVSITGDILQCILGNSPLLDSLRLHCCPLLETITVSSHSLRKLTIIDQSSTDEIQICTPKLESFIFFGEHIFGCNWDMTSEPGDSFIDISSLSDAFISSIGMEHTEPEHDYIQLLYDLRHVKVLTICTATLMRVGTYEDIRFPIIFQNLQELQLLMDWMSTEYLAYLFEFFRLCSSPILDKLFIQLPSIPGDSNEEFALMKVPVDSPDVVYTTVNVKEMEDPSDVMFHHLKVIKMNQFKGCASEMRLVKFLLGKATVLESLVLVAPPVHVSKNNMEVEMSSSTPDMMSKETIDLMSLQRQISMFTAASPSAKVELLEYVEDDNRFTPTHTEYFHNF